MTAPAYAQPRPAVRPAAPAAPAAPPAPRGRAGRPLVAAVETSGLYTTKAGVARYIRGLLRGLAALDRPGLRVEEVAWPVENFGYAQPARAIKTAWRELVWAPLLAPRQVSAAGAGVLHGTCDVLAEPPGGVAHVATLHDLAFLRHPERFRRWQRTTGVRRLRRLAGCDRVIAISRFTADEGIALLGLPASRIEVVHNGFDFDPDAPERPPQPAERSGDPPGDFPAEFFLFVGSLEPGKNLSLLREAYLAAESQGRPLPPLAIVGARWEGVAREAAAPAGWRYLGRQDDAVLAWLYRRALALLFPSKYEGFGLPLLEAMALGCPVVCSPVASLPEVAGDAARYADPSPDAYLAAARDLSGAGSAARRADLVAAGHERVGHFGWDKCARETADVYEAAAR